MKRILALDVGDKRTGVAVSDELGITAQGVETIQTRGLERDAQRVAQLAGEYGTERILIGLPRKLDYSEG
ncbi:MAG: Holliday junction resolvase RuvX, partial [Clostridiales bacterium]|nr:Holliday junction resolvase RuvX [Clostridiales bacterium]